MEYINYNFRDGYDAGTSLEEVINDYHGEQAKEHALFWQDQYGINIGYNCNHTICSYVNCENIIHLAVGFNDDGEVEFYVELYICDAHDDTDIFSTIEEAVENYKNTIHRCLNGEFGRIDV